MSKYLETEEQATEYLYGIMYSLGVDPDDACYISGVDWDEFHSCRRGDNGGMIALAPKLAPALNALFQTLLKNGWKNRGNYVSQMKDIRQNELTRIPVVVVCYDGAWRPYPEVETTVVPDAMSLLQEIGAAMVSEAFRGDLGYQYMRFGEEVDIRVTAGCVDMVMFYGCDEHSLPVTLGNTLLEHMKYPTGHSRMQLAGMARALLGNPSQ